MADVLLKVGTAYPSRAPMFTPDVCVSNVVSVSELPVFIALSDFSNVYIVKTMCFAGCIDNHPSCHDWSVRGECSRNPAYMLVSCKKSCGKCSGTLCSYGFEHIYYFMQAIKMIIIIGKL